MTFGPLPDLPLPEIVKGEPVPCCYCRGSITFGALTYPEWQGRGFPLSWHSEPHCSSYRKLPNSAAAVLELARRCGLT